MEGSPGALTLACARVANGEGGISASPAWVAINDGRITATGVGAPPQPAVDLGDALLAPGFVDIQVNGFRDVDFATASVDDIVATVDELRAHGTTGLLLTFCTAPLDAYDEMLARAASARAARPDVVLGVHLEGPFLGGAPGAHPAGLVRPVDVAFLERALGETGDLVRLVTLAPEADPGATATRFLVERGVKVALGHSNASYDDARAFADAGASIATHLFNAMGPLHHRAPGLAGAALTDPRLRPSLIADFVHVHPAIVGLALRARPDAVVVTDAVADAHARLADGTLGGSTAALDTALRNLTSLGIPVAHALRHVGANPSRALAMHDRGRIAPGARADLVALDPETFEVHAVWSGGG